MSFAAHGNWCGPGWSARQWKDAKDLTEEDKQVEAVDALDQACKEHDIGIAEGDPDANKKFYEKAAAASWYGLSLAQLVKIGGPSLQNYLRGGKKNMPRKNIKDKEEEYEAWKSSNSIRLRKKQEKTRKEQRDFTTDENRVYTVDAQGETEERKRKAEEDLDDVSELEDRNRVVDEFPVVNPDDAIHATIDEEMNQNLQTPVMVPRVREPTMTREDQPLRGPREEGSLTNLLNQVDNNMGDKDVEMQPLALRSMSSNSESTTNNGNKETMVRYNSRAEMGIFTETRTAYLPLTVYFSINRVDMITPIPLHFRVDWPFDIFKRNTLREQKLALAYDGGWIRQWGLSNDMASFGNRRSTQSLGGLSATAGNFNTLAVGSRDPALNQGQLFPFPTTVVGATAAVQGTPLIQGASSYGAINDSAVIPAYRRWYAKMYQYAHCMETDWKVTYFSGDANEEFQNVRVYEGMDCQSTGNTDTIPVDAELGTVDHWPYLKKHNLVQRRESNARQDYTISGQWRPGMQHPMKMIPNTEEIKTWTKLGSSDFIERSPANYREDVTLLHYSHPDSNNQAAFVNVRVDLRYKIQFKDLDNKLRWPKANLTPLTLASNDCIQTPYPTQTIGVGAQPERIFANGVTPR